jgi:endonuclease/exonuclease/phosphatase (EEP) superfamily protein YafD
MMSEPNNSSLATFAHLLRHNILRLSTVSAWGLAVISVVTLLARDWWLADLFANLRVQDTIGLLLTATTQTCFRRWRLLALSLLCIMLHLPWFASGIPSGSTGDPAGTPLLSVTTANVFTANQRYSDIESELTQSNSDVVAIVELSSDLAAHLSQNFVRQYPYSIKQPLDLGNFGIGLYSKRPFETAKIMYFNSDDIPSIAATVVCQEQRIHILATHTLPPMGRFGFAHRNTHLRMVTSYVQERRRAHPDVPLLVVGDLNITPWSPVYHDFLNASQLASAGTGAGWTPTWYLYPAFPFGLVLDHVLMTRELACQSYTVGSDAGSDHRFVTTQLTPR